MKELKSEKINEIWKITLAQLEIKIDSPAYFRTWFSGTQLKKIEDGKAIIAVPNSYAINWIKRKDNQVVKETVSYVSGMDLDPEYIYEEKNEYDYSSEKKSKKEQPNPVLIDTISNKTSTSVNLSRSGLNSKYTFKNFIVGSNNRLAHAAALAIADNPGNSYNPFFVHGPTGVGKTHLMEAIGLGVLEKYPNKKVLYTSSEEFLNEMVAAIRSNNGSNFRNKYRRLDLLIIDDIQFISKWVETQNELFHTFNTLYQDNKQIIFASDRPPEKINNLEERLKSRFRGGMVADIGAPDFEHRLAIIRQKASQMHLELTDVIENYLASVFVDNI
ncbi:ATP-binding protein, partial [Candidatus Dojkabacteria bacterium]|nr:ATP-binding protein [Candidatus Dojkabacteria bacterium]